MQTIVAPLCYNDFALTLTIWPTGQRNNKFFDEQVRLFAAGINHPFSFVPRELEETAPTAEVNRTQHYISWKAL